MQFYRKGINCIYNNCCKRGAILAKVISVSSSPGRGTPKYAVKEGNFIKDFGMEGDGVSIV
jgi:hypothetical protein